MCVFVFCFCFCFVFVLFCLLVCCCFNLSASKHSQADLLLTNMEYKKDSSIITYLILLPHILASPMSGAQNGGTHSRVVRDFQTNKTRKGVTDCCVSVLYSVFRDRALDA